MRVTPLLLLLPVLAHAAAVPYKRAPASDSVNVAGPTDTKVASVPSDTVKPSSPPVDVPPTNSPVEKPPTQSAVEPAPSTQSAAPTTKAPSADKPATSDAPPPATTAAPPSADTTPAVVTAAPSSDTASPVTEVVVTSTADVPTRSSGQSNTVLTSIMTTATRITSSVRPSASTSAASDKSEESSGVSKGAIIGIVVAAAIIGVIIIGWTLFRKWKLKPSNRFDSRTQPIDFSPDNGAMGDDFIEKTLHRSASSASADRQRQMYVQQLEDDPHNLVAGVPEHDFTAGSANTNGYMYGGYGNDQYGHGPHDQYGNDQYANDPHDQYAHGSQDQYNFRYPQTPDPVATAYPPQAGVGSYHYDYPTQDPSIAGGDVHAFSPDAGYADLHRGPSLNQGGPSPPPGSMSVPQPAMTTSQNTSWNDPLATSDFNVAGRPTAGEGPYAQAAAYRY